MLLLMMANSCCEADQDALLGNPSDGGGPESLRGSGDVDDLFEFSRHIGGGIVKSMEATSSVEIRGRRL